MHAHELFLVSNLVTSVSKMDLRDQYTGVAWGVETRGFRCEPRKATGWVSAFWWFESGPDTIPYHTDASPLVRLRNNNGLVFE